jgi:hypothetical protein
MTLSQTVATALAVVVTASVAEAQQKTPRKPGFGGEWQ